MKKIHHSDSALSIGTKAPSGLPKEEQISSMLLESLNLFIKPKKNENNEAPIQQRSATV